MTDATVVLCIGNPFRRDDGAGHAVAEHARHTLPESVHIVQLDGEPTRIIDAWTGAGLAIVVDAVRSADRAGTIRRFEIDGESRVPPVRPASTHGYGVTDAIELARVLGRLPARLVVYTIEGEDYSVGPGLSDAVARAVDQVATRLVDDLCVR